MKKMTWYEWKAQELAKREEYKKMGVIDAETIRTEKMWHGPNVKDEDLPAAKFEFDRELGYFVFAGYANQVEH
jgi:hypothetical protein